MQSGLITSENIGQILRTISQKKQSGALEMNFPDVNINLIFANGKIIDAYEVSSPSFDRVRTTLVSAGLLAEQQAESAEDLKDLLGIISEVMEIDNAQSEQKLKTVIKHDLLDFLYNINLDRTAVYNFKNYIPEYDKNFIVGISIGQFLLDKASYESEMLRFEKTFQSDSRIMKLDLAGLTLSEEEQILYDSLKNSATIKEVINSRILSRYHLITGLMSFYERAVVEIETAPVGQAESPPDISVINVLEVNSERPYVERDLTPEMEEVIASAKIDSVIEEEKIASSEKIIKSSTAFEERDAHKAGSLRNYDFSQYIPVCTALLCLICAGVIVGTAWSKFFIEF